MGDLSGEAAHRFSKHIQRPGYGTNHDTTLHVALAGEPTCLRCVLAATDNMFGAVWEKNALPYMQQEWCWLRLLGPAEDGAQGKKD